MFRGRFQSINFVYLMGMLGLSFLTQIKGFVIVYMLIHIKIKVVIIVWILDHVDLILIDVCVVHECVC